MLNNLKIGVRLTFSYLSGLFVMFGIVLFATIKMTSIDNEIQNIDKVQFPKTIWANNIINNVQEIGLRLREIPLTKDTVESVKLKARVQFLADNTAQIFDSLKRTATTEKEKELLAKSLELRDQYIQLRNSILKSLDYGNNQNAVTILLSVLKTAETNYISAINDLINYQNEGVNTAVLQAYDINNSAKNLLHIIGIFAFLLVIGFAVTITKSIIDPINIVADRVKQLQTEDFTNLGNGLLAMSSGDLTTKVEKTSKLLSFDRKDEIGSMANTLDKMIMQAHGGIDAYEITRGKINELISETGALISAGKEGKLDTRGNYEKFEGAYKGLVKGVNDTLDAMILPIKEGSNVLEIMSNGDFTVRMTREYRGEHQLIKNSINKLGDSVGSVLNNVAEEVSATASATTQIFSSSEEMAAGAQEQSSQAQEVAAAVDQMTKTILETTKNAGNTADAAKNAGQIAKDGGKIVLQTIEGMNRIANVVTKAAETIQELGKNSDQIGEIIQVIDDIADQTNLLALNAAIEAARAGEQGRGFAVVADEVRKLAERTTKATKEIADMIKRIQRDTNEAVESIQQGAVEVQKGKELASKASESLEQIISGSQEVVDQAIQVASASEEQSASAEQISRNIEAISSVTQQSVTGVQQIARAVGDLNKLTENLQNLVSKFNIDSKRSDYKSKVAIRSNDRIMHF